MTDLLTPTPAGQNAGDGAPSASLVRTLISRITRFEYLVGALIAAVMLVLVVIEPNILEAPFENERTILFTVGGTALAALAFAAMLWLRVPALIRVVVLVVPFVIVNWWLISPYFIDDVVDEEFSTSISAQLATPDQVTEAPGAPVTPEPVSEPATETAPIESPAGEAPAADAADDPAVAEPAADEPADAAPPAEQPPAAEAPAEAPAQAEEPAPAPTGPVLLGAGQFVGLAGHDGTGDAGIFQNPDGTLTLRFENFDIENGPDLEVYLVPGADQVSLPDGSIHLGALKGNIGDQNYELPPGTQLAPGAYTALVWCEAFSVEFVGATIVV
ncbi:MAG: DM13 domain-containing protein [Actinomycetota bacterium]